MFTKKKKKEDGEETNDAKADMKWNTGRLNLPFKLLSNEVWGKSSVQE